MEVITELSKINFFSYIIATFLIFVAFKGCVLAFEWIINFFGIETKWMRRRKSEHSLLIKTSENLTKLQEKHEESVKQSIIHDNQIKENLSEFMSDMKKSIEETQKEIKQYAENRLHDREQSLQIQKDLTDSIKKIVERNTTKDKQIDDLMIAQREVLADKINEKYKYYISIKGIPEDEVDEFTNLHTAYKGVGGNHSGDAKYEYCINHLSVIPVETKLVIKES